MLHDEKLAAQPNNAPTKHCADCRHFHKGYRLQVMKVPSFCNAAFCSVSHDDPACKDFAEKDHADAV